MARLVDFGATNEPGTCLWCGVKLVRQLRQEERRVPLDSEEGEQIRAHRSKLENDALNLEYESPERTRLYRQRHKWQGWNVLLGGHSYVLTRYVPDPTREPGHLDSGCFCSLGCGFQFALTFARAGRRLEAKHE